MAVNRPSCAEAPTLTSSFPPVSLLLSSMAICSLRSSPRRIRSSCWGHGAAGQREGSKQSNRQTVTPPSLEGAQPPPPTLTKATLKN